MEPDFLKDLLDKEKALRQAEEVKAFESAQVLCDLMTRLHDCSDLDGIREWVQILAKRRRQPKQAIATMVQQCVGYLDELPADNPLLHTLRKVCEGKIYLEVEFARLTKKLSMLREEERLVKEASELLQEVQVETYGSMDKHEKLQFLLEQMRLLLELEEYVRFQIVSNKVNRKVLDEDGMEGEKVKFLHFMIRYYEHTKNYMEIALCYRTCYQMKHPLVEPVFSLQQMMLHLMLVECSPEQLDLLRNYRDREEQDFTVRGLLGIILGKEIGWISEETAQLLAPEKLQILQRRVTQHNVRIIQSYYSKITLRRMAELLRLTAEETEAELRDMVSYQGFQAKINRPERYVHFVRPFSVHSQLNEWGSDIFSLLSRLEEITHLIHRESLVIPN